jgi:sulfur-carrier protein
MGQIRLGGVAMAIRVRVPTPLRKFTNGADEVNAQGSSVRAIVDDLEKSFPGIKDRICDESGKIRRFVNVYVNGDDIRFLQNMETGLKEGDNISIVPAIAGGTK